MNGPLAASYEFSGFRVDPVRRLLVGLDGEPVLLKPKVFDTLLYLVEHAGELCEKRALMEAIWPGLVVEENNLNQNVSALRRVLGEKPNEHRFIVTEPGRGYRFVATVRALTDSGSSAPEQPGPSAAPTPADSSPPAPRSAPVTAAPVEPALQRDGRIASAALGSRTTLGFATAAALVALVVAIVYWATDVAWREDAASTAEPSADVLPNSVAVLPFEVIGADPDQIADGLHIELIYKLSQMGLTVKARGAVLRYAGSAPMFATIAAEQRVESILVGSLQQAGDQLKVNVTLVNPSGTVLRMIEPYSVVPTDVFQVQADIAAKVADALRFEPPTTARDRFARRPTDAAGAQVAYWQALAVRDVGPRTRALELLEEAVRIDPDFAEAHAELALLYARSLVDWFSDPAPTATPDWIHARVMDHAARALLIDEGQATAHAAIAEANVYLWRWNEAARAFADAYRVNPRDMNVLVFYSQFNSFRGEFEAAIDLADRLRELDENWLFNTWLAYTYAGRIDEALVWLDRQLTIDERAVTAWLNLGFVEARREHRDAAARAFRKVEELAGARLSASATASLARGYRQIGLNDDARRLFDTLQSRRNTETISDAAWAMAYLAIGDRDEASAALQRAVEKIGNHEPEQAWFSLMILKHNVSGDPVLEESPFKELRVRIRGD